MIAKDIERALFSIWPEQSHLHIPEAPQDSSRQGRKIDVLVISTWGSRGYERNAIEIKVSASDLKRELDKPEKADWWWAHSHHFWLATPKDLAAKVKDDIPATWGLISVDEEGKTRKVVKAPKNRKPKPIPETAMIGMLRCVSGITHNALATAQQRGYKQGMEVAKSRGDDMPPQERQLAWENERLKQTIAAFQEASGFSIENLHRAQDLGRFAAFTDKIATVSNLGRRIRGARAHLGLLETALDDIEGLLSDPKPKS